MLKADNWLVKKWIEHLLKAEGGYVNNKKDLGGETNLGITYYTFSKSKKLNFVKPQLTTLKQITINQAVQIYQKMYIEPVINKLNIMGIVITPSAYIHLLDVAVNSGPIRAYKMVVQAAKDDNKVTQKEMVQLRKLWYNTIVSYNISQKMFLSGWNNRVNNLVKWLSGHNQNE